MLLLPDEGEPTVGAQVNALIGEALRQSAPEVAPSAGFTARLAAALDEVDEEKWPPQQLDTKSRAHLTPS